MSKSGIPVPVSKEVTASFAAQRDQLLAHMDEGLACIGEGLRIARESAEESRAVLQRIEDMDDADRLALELDGKAG